MSSVFGALVPAVELHPVDSLGPVHFIAIGGAGMSGIAAAYAQLGVRVQGSDQAWSASCAELAEAGVTVFTGHAAEQLGDAETVVVSSAIRADNPELVAARERGLRIWHRSSALAALQLDRPAVAVGGTHGKTTTTAMIAHVLTEVGRDPGYVVGAPLASTGHSSALGAPDAPFVVEADESDGSFLQYPADIVVVTNIEADHLDNWGTPARYAEGFSDFVSGGRERDREPTAVLNADDPGTLSIFGEPDAEDPRWQHSFGMTAPGTGLRIEQVRADGFGTRAVVGGHPLELLVPGLHNVHNAAAALAACRLLGVEVADGARALASFRGTHRRFTPVGSAHGIQVFDDYAHHPTELTATLLAARAGVGEHRVIACFQPHLFSRTRDFAEEFGQALALADEVLLAPVFGAREEPLPGVDSGLLVGPCEAAGGSVRLLADAAELPGAVADLAEGGDVVITLGAGDITTWAPQILAVLDDRGPSRATPEGPR